MLPHLDAAYTLARYLLRDSADADDVVQDACLRALRHFGTFRGGTTEAARGWFLAIVRNTAWTWRRRGGSRETLEFDEAQHSDDESGARPDAALLRRETRASLAQALDAIRPTFREVLILREVQGLSYKEIGDVVGVPTGTVMSRLARARDALQAAWKGDR